MHVIVQSGPAMHLSSPAPLPHPAGHASVRIAPPVVRVLCPGQEETPTTHQDVLPADGLYWAVPAGRYEHYDMVSIGTVLATVLASLVLLVSLTPSQAAASSEA